MQTAKKKWWFTPVILLLSIVAVHVFALRADWVENIYSACIYPAVSLVLRFVTRWLPFSLGDVLYGLALIWLIIKIIQFFRHRPTWIKFLFALRNLVVKCLYVYLFFFISWGLNYYRYGIGYKLQLHPEMYSTEELKTVTRQLLDSLNANRRRIDSLHINYTDSKTVFKQAILLYDSAKIKYPELTYNLTDVKKMMFSDIGNYSGFLGYYNPFTGEAQVNEKVPAFTIPFTTCHEIGHQLGFASESEASFVGYLTIRSGNSPVFNYSAYFELFGFANGELYSRDSAVAIENKKLLDTLVRKDYVEYRKYLKRYQNPVEPLLSKLYGNYLKAHNQPKGIDSYDEVVAWTIAYYKKYGKL